jgi:Transcriptional regulator, AbiEi antitoxin, Type IV TA system/Transcriptional regulator, AbiEi antitoxin N-terminal domain
MDKNPRHALIKKLQTTLPRGTPFDLGVLGSIGVSAQLAAHYAESGWLDRLGQGVYAFAGDTVTAHGAVKLLQTRVVGLHVGGKSALALQGVRHNLARQETLVLWGGGGGGSDKRFMLPAWFSSRFPSRYVAAKLFGTLQKRRLNKSLTTPPGVSDGLSVSVPERAVLELLYDVGTHQGLEEARNLFDGVRNLRKEVLGELLQSCTSVKAVRLFLTWARETRVVDVEALRNDYALPVGSEKRWISRMKDGSLLSLKAYG